MLSHVVNIILHDDSQLHFYKWSDQKNNNKKKNTLKHHCEIEKKKKYGHKGKNIYIFLERPLSEFVTLVLSSVYICFPIEGSWDVPLSNFRELVCHWLIYKYILFISESQDSLAQFMANL